MAHEEQLQLGVFIIIQIQGQFPFKDARLDKCVHASYVLHWRTHAKRYLFFPKSVGLFKGDGNERCLF